MICIWYHIGRARIKVFDLLSIAKLNWFVKIPNKCLFAFEHQVTVPFFLLLCFFKCEADHFDT